MQMLLKQLSNMALTFVRNKFKDLRGSLDADGDGVKDFDEYPKLFEDLREGIYEAIDAIDMKALNEVIQQAPKIADVDELKAASRKVFVAGAELFKLASLAIKDAIAKTKE